MSALNNSLQLLWALLPKQHILLLSHMRAYTSLFGHIIGSNPAICGYYEMHIGYYSWKSLVRQKLLYFREEPVKPGFWYMFDKILHNDHSVSPNILSRSNTRVIFSLRHPRDTLPSILALYEEVDPVNEFNSPGYALEYYVKRLATLDDIATNITQPFYYLDAEVLVNDADGCLANLGEWLQLETPLSTNYDTQKKTSRKRYGDTSAKLQAGTIVTTDTNKEHPPLDEAMLERATEAYHATRETLARHSESHSLHYPGRVFPNTT